MYKLVPKAWWHQILAWIYKKREIVVQRVWFSKEDESLKGECQISSKGAYGRIPIKYVTAENFVRCCSQLGYLIMYLVRESKTEELLHVSRDRFRELAVKHRMFYHFLSIKFSKQTPKDIPFPLTLQLEKILHKSKMTICYLAIGGAIQGQLKFVGISNGPELEPAYHDNYGFWFLASWSIAAAALVIFAIATGNMQGFEKILIAFY